MNCLRKLYNTGLWRPNINTLIVIRGHYLLQVHALSKRLISEALLQLGVVKDMSPEAVADTGAYRRFYCHSVGHWLGMDTHDTSSVSHDRALEPGVIITVEPGIYIPDEER